jgi:hypothetical protein
VGVEGARRGTGAGVEGVHLGQVRELREYTFDRRGGSEGSTHWSGERVGGVNLGQGNEWGEYTLDMCGS